MVIIEDLDGKYYRGYLKYREEKNIFYVNRIDIGDDICIQSRNIYYLPESLFKLGVQRHTIKLYGIIPSSEVTRDQLWVSFEITIFNEIIFLAELCIRIQYLDFK